MTIGHDDAERFRSSSPDFLESEAETSGRYGIATVLRNGLVNRFNRCHRYADDFWHLPP